MNAPISKPRDAALSALRQEEPFDLLIVGGGIVGAGVARDAAMRGLKTALVEQHDFAFGTSSRSSRLLHGGLRYLAQGRVGLVREASVEKTILHRIAPHLAEPLAFIFPTYRGTDWPLWQLRIGVKVYDLLCSGRNLGKSSGMNQARTLGLLPGLQPDKLSGAVRYFDGLANDARLVLDTLRSASRAGAVLSNYTRFLDAQRDGATWRVELEDTLSSEHFTASAKAVINATGPWADGTPHSAVKLRLTKGIHVVVDRSRMPVPDAVVVTEGKRILFVIPWGERVIIGTTDTDYTGRIEDVRTDAADVAYVLKTVGRFFPNARLSEGDVISSWAGLRPLIADPNGKPSDISRSHQIRSPEPGWWDVAGGKLTTYRLMAEQTVDQVSAALRLKADPCATADEPLLPLNETAGLSGIVPPAFGRDAVEHFCWNEWAVHLDDVMIRRSSWHHYHRDSAAKALLVAEWMGEVLGWSAETRRAELVRYHEQSDWPVRSGAVSVAGGPALKPHV